MGMNRDGPPHAERSSRSASASPDLFLHRGHPWTNLLFSGQVKVGVDDFLQRLLGRIDGIALPPLGATVKEGEPFVTVRQGGRTASLRFCERGREKCSASSPFVFPVMEVQPAHHLRLSPPFPCSSGPRTSTQASRHLDVDPPPLRILSKTGSRRSNLPNMWQV